MIQVIGRQLIAPSVAYATKSKVSTNYRSSWNIKEMVKGKDRYFKMVTSGDQFVPSNEVVTCNRSWTWVRIESSQSGNLKDGTGENVLTELKALVRKANDMGVNMTTFEKLDPNCQKGGKIPEGEASSKLMPLLKGAKDEGKCSLVFVVLPRKDTVLYNTIKNIADVDIGIHTICIDQSKIIITEKNPPARINDTLGNIALKINLKSGQDAVNQTLEANKSNLLYRQSTMLVGYDVTHPTGMVKKKPKEPSKMEDLVVAQAKLKLSPQSKSPRQAPPNAQPEPPAAPSIVGLVASIDRHASTFPGSTWKNRPRDETAASNEMVADQELAQHFKDCLDRWTNAYDAKKLKNNRKNPEGKPLPDNIVIFRDGVSEGQFQQVLDKELPHFRTACAEKYAERALPKITLVVSVKRHHTRFFPTNNSPTVCDQTGSPKAGTVIDRGVTNMRYWDFYLQSHTAIQGDFP